MNTDREMLELAAKAAGAEWHSYPEKHVPGRWLIKNVNGAWVQWSPLTDDGDALRLAVSLGLLVDSDEHLGESEAMGMGVRQRVAHEADKYAATRRAITRAAAEIGRGMA